MKIKEKEHDELNFLIFNNVIQHCRSIVLLELSFLELHSSGFVEYIIQDSIKVLKILEYYLL